MPLHRGTAKTNHEVTHILKKKKKRKGENGLTNVPTPAGEHKEKHRKWGIKVQAQVLASSNGHQKLIPKFWILVHREKEETPKFNF